MAEYKEKVEEAFKKYLDVVKFSLSKEKYTSCSNVLKAVLEYYIHNLELDGNRLIITFEHRTAFSYYTENSDLINDILEECREKYDIVPCYNFYLLDDVWIRTKVKQTLN